MLETIALFLTYLLREFRNCRRIGRILSLFVLVCNQWDWFCSIHSLVGSGYPASLRLVRPKGNPNSCNAQGRIINKLFKDYGLFLFSIKKLEIGQGKRPKVRGNCIPTYSWTCGNFFWVIKPVSFFSTSAWTCMEAISALRRSLSTSRMTTSGFRKQSLRV